MKKFRCGPWLVQAWREGRDVALRVYRRDIYAPYALKAMAYGTRKAGITETRWVDNAEDELLDGAYPFQEIDEFLDSLTSEADYA